MKKISINTVKAALENRKPRSAWDRGVKLYALELIDELNDHIRYGNFAEEDITSPRVLEKAMLNGASCWPEYSWGGCSLIYNEEIAERLCTATELKRTHDGQREPNARERWLDVQARALFQAAQLIHYTVNELKEVA